MRYHEIEQYISKLPKYSESHPIDHVRGMLEGMDPACSPDHYKVVHVTGTNGKGSVCCFLSSILTESGKRVGMFTSPHLVTMRERIRINGEPVSEQDFSDAFDEVMGLADRKQAEGMTLPTFFEFLFLMAMTVFRNAKVEYVILEAGMGGRLDTTNVVSFPLVSMITSISLDHTEQLGKTIPQIAYEKSGILKPGVPVIYRANHKEAYTIVKNRAMDLHCPGYPIGEEQVQVLSNTGSEIRFYVTEKESEVYTIHTGAVYQPFNAGLAIKAAGLLGFTDYDTIRRGLEKAYWPGRMDEIASGVYVDGGHNPEGADSFVCNVKALESGGRLKGRRILVFAVTSDKDYEYMVGALCGLPWDRVITTTYFSRNCIDAESLAEIFRKYRAGAPVEAVQDPQEAFRKAISDKTSEDTVFATGSLYLAGVLLSMEEFYAKF